MLTRDTGLGRVWTALQLDMSQKVVTTTSTGNVSDDHALAIRSNCIGGPRGSHGIDRNSGALMNWNPCRGPPDHAEINRSRHGQALEDARKPDFDNFLDNSAYVL